MPTDRSNGVGVMASRFRARLQCRIASANAAQFRDLFAASLTLPCHIETDAPQIYYESQARRCYYLYQPSEFDPLDALNDAAAVLSRLAPGAPSLAAIDEFHLVMNDAYRMNARTCPALRAALEGWRQRNGWRQCRLFIASDLEDRLMRLPPPDLIRLIGTLPNFNVASAVFVQNLLELLQQFFASAARAAHSECAEQGVAVTAIEPGGRPCKSDGAADEFDPVRAIHTADWLAAARLHAPIARSLLASLPMISRQQIHRRIGLAFERCRARELRDIAGGPTQVDQWVESLIVELVPAFASDCSGTSQAAALALVMAADTLDTLDTDGPATFADSKSDAIDSGSGGQQADAGTPQGGR